MENLPPIIFIPCLIILITTVVMLVIGLIYVVVRVGSIAHFRTKAEYDRVFNRTLNGEHDAKK